MKKFLAAVISLVIFAMVAYGVTYLVMPVNSIELTEYTHSVSFVCEDTFIARDETVYYSDTAGIVYNIATDGARVAQDEKISTVYDGQVNSDYLKMLHTLNTKISTLKSDGHSSKLYGTDTEASESEISDKMMGIFDLAKSNNIEKIHFVKEEINGIRKGVHVATSDKIDALTDERERIEKSIHVGKSDIVSDRSGIFSSYVDGLETRLIPEAIEKFSVKDIKKLKAENSEYINGKTVAAHTPVCKVMNNHVWYITGIIDSDRAKMLKETPNVTIRFTNLTETDVAGEVTYISEPDEDGSSIFIIKVSSYVESAFSYRNISTQIIFEEHSGYRVPTDAIRTGEGISDYFVYARKGSESYKCDVDVLYSDTAEGYSIIRSDKDADNKLGSMDRLIVGER